MIYLELFWTFFKIGLFTFGGGYAMLPLIQKEVLLKGWIEETALIDFIAVSESTPGPFAINTATYIGTEVGAREMGEVLGPLFGGFIGAAGATLGVVLPSFIIILIVAKVFEKFKQNKFVAGAMTGLKPAVIGMISAAVVSIGKTVFFPNGLDLSVLSSAPFYISLGIFAVMFVLSLKKVHPIIIICLSAVIGIGVGFFLGLTV